jgi:hypothetical protein
MLRQEVVTSKGLADSGAGCLQARPMEQAVLEQAVASVIDHC